MNKIVILSLGMTITLTLFFVIYLIPYFSKKKIRQGKFDLFQFMNLFFAPLLIIPLLYFSRQIIISNPEKYVIIIPSLVSELSFLGLLYFLILGNGIHSVSVVLSKHMKGLKKHDIWNINEFFHNAFSHFLITASAVLILFSFSILEINRPNPIMLSMLEIFILIICGILAGIVLGLASIEGSIPQIMFYLLYVLSISLPMIFFWHNLNFRFFPFTTFIESVLVVSVFTISIYKYKKKGFPEIVPHHFFED